MIKWIKNFFKTKEQRLIEKKLEDRARLISYSNLLCHIAGYKDPADAYAELDSGVLMATRPRLYIGLKCIRWDLKDPNYSGEVR